MVPVVGVEPTRYRYHWILSPARLPIPSYRHESKAIISHSRDKIKHFFIFLQKNNTFCDSPFPILRATTGKGAGTAIHNRRPVAFSPVQMPENRKLPGSGEKNWAVLSPDIRLAAYIANKPIAKENITDMEQNNGTPPAAPDMTGTGYLIVQVTTARGAIPLEGAKVDIRSYEAEDTSAPETRGDVIASLTSGRDGNTPRVSLPAPPRAASESPGNGRPYSLYQAEVTLDGYFAQTYIGIPIFDGITAIQPAVMIPLPENGTNGLPRPDEIRYYESSTADL